MEKTTIENKIEWKQKVDQFKQKFPSFLPNKMNKQKKEHKSLSTVILPALVTAILLPLLAVLFITYNQTSNLLTKRVEEQEKQITTNLAANIGTAAAGAEKSIERLALDGRLIQAAANKEVRLGIVDSFNQIITGNSYFADAYYILADKEVVGTLRTAGKDYDPE